MEKKEETFGFYIADKDGFDKSVNPKNNKNFAIGSACAKAVKNMVNRIEEKDQSTEKSFFIDAPYNESTVRKCVADRKLTQTALHGILCLFFHKFEKDSKYDISYNRDSIFTFLKSIKIVGEEQGSVKKFRDFFAKLDIPEHFGSGFEITIDSDWKFNITEFEENQSQRDSKENDSTSYDQKAGDDTGESQKDTIPKKKNISLYNILLSLVVLFIIGWFSYPYFSKSEVAKPENHIDSTKVKEKKTIKIDSTHMDTLNNNKLNPEMNVIINNSDSAKIDNIININKVEKLEL